MKIIIITAYLLMLSICGFCSHVEPAPFTLVIFGSTGDLAARKLFPAIYNLRQNNEIHENFSIVGIGRRDFNEETFRTSVYNSLQKFSLNKPANKSWNSFKEHIFYHKADFNEDANYVTLKAKLAEFDRQAGRVGNYIFYLATDSCHFSTIIHHLYKNGLINQNDISPSSRVVIEKPFGEDLDSAIELQSSISQYLKEEQIFRMDHYLGKEGVHKLLKFRFQDGRFDSLFNEKYVNTIQITLSETIGIGTRACFYENTGHLRDVIQNHAMQLLALVTMEPPESICGYDLLKEKAKVLDAIRPFPEGKINQYVARGQYTSGEIQGTSVLGYREEEGVPQSSQVETFVQAKMFIDNPRWSGVPIFIRSGKRLPEQLTQVTLNLKENPFGLERVTIRIQPDPAIFLTRNSKRDIYEVSIDPNFSKEAYENLVLAAIQGDQSHFVTIEEVISTWTLLTPVLKSWSRSSLPIELYKAGQWGTKTADEQAAEYNLNWSNR
jgi:glucose-6-phosphate 1-dehydrogenase